MHDKYVNKISAVEGIFAAYSFWVRGAVGRGIVWENKFPKESSFSTLESSVVCL